MTCDRETVILISCYADGEASPEEAVRAAAHLATCPDCRRLVADWQGQRKVFQWAFTIPVRELEPVPQVERSVIREGAMSVMRRIRTVPAWIERHKGLVLTGSLAAASIVVGLMIHHFLITPPLLRTGTFITSTRHTQAARMEGDVQLTLGPDSKISRIDANSIRLERGWVSASVPHGTGFRVLTPRMQVLDQGTVFKVGTGDRLDYVSVTEGYVSVSKDKNSYAVNHDQVLVAGDKGSPRVVSLPAIDGFDKMPRVRLTESAAYFGRLPATAEDLDWADGLRRLASRFPNARLEFANSRDGGTMRYGVKPMEIRQNWARLLGFRQGVRAHFVDLVQAAYGGRVNAAEWQIPVGILQVSGIISPVTLPGDVYLIQLVSKDGAVVWRLTGSMGSQTDLPFKSGSIGEYKNVDRGLARGGSAFSTVTHEDGTQTMTYNISYSLTDLPVGSRPVLSLSPRGIPTSEIENGKEEMLTDIDQQILVRKDFMRDSGTLLYMDAERTHHCLVAWNQEAAKQLCHLSDRAKHGQGGSVIIAALATDVSLDQPKMEKGVYLLRFRLQDHSDSSYLEIASPDARNAAPYILNQTKPRENNGGFGTSPDSLAGYGTVQLSCDTRISNGQGAAKTNTFPIFFQVIGRPDDKSTRKVVTTDSHGQVTRTSLPIPTKVWAQGQILLSKP